MRSSWQRLYPSDATPCCPPTAELVVPFWGTYGAAQPHLPLSAQHVCRRTACRDGSGWPRTASVARLSAAYSTVTQEPRDRLQQRPDALAVTRCHPLLPSHPAHGTSWPVCQAVKQAF